MTQSSVYVDYADAKGVAGMVIGGMTVAERVLRDAARSGATRAVVRGDALPVLPALSLAVEVIPPTASPPSDVPPIPGDVIAGQRIVDEGSRKLAESALLQTCRRPYDGLGDRFVIRAISLRITRLCCVLGISPNQVTSLNIVVGLLACLLVTRGTTNAFLAAGGLMFLQVILDSCDGEIARIRHMHSAFGMWLDNTSDDVIDTAFIACLGIGMGGIWAIVGIAAATVRGLVALTIHITVARMGKPGDVMAFKWWFDTDDDNLAERYEPTMSLGMVVRAFGRRDFYVLVWAFSCIAQVPLVGLFLGSVNAVVHGVMGLLHISKR